jgi:hypothetical protein
VPGWRLTFDEPITEVIEPGGIKTWHAYDLIESDSNRVGTWQEPLTGLIMLNPSFLRDSWYTSAGWRGLSQWITSTNWWEVVYRGNTALAGETARFWGNIYSPDIGNAYPAVSGYLPSILNFGAIVGATLFQSAIQDTLVFAAQSTFNLARDEGFVWHVRFEADELHRFRNLLYLQWDDIGFHLASDGTLTAARYPNGPTNAPVYFDSVNLGQLGKIHNRDLYIAFIPIPGHGIAVHVTSDAPQASITTNAINSNASLASHLFRFPQRIDVGNFYVHNGGVISVYTLPIDALGWGAPIRYKFGYHAIRYQTGTGSTYVGPIFDWGYLPTQTASVTPLKVEDGRGTVTASLRYQDGTTAWATGTNESRRGRVALVFSTTNAIYTPFVRGAQVQVQRLTQVRGTTARVMKWQKIEFTTDELGKVEGIAECRATTPEEWQIFRRGDAPWRLEWSFDPDSIIPNWQTVGGGLARLLPDSRYAIEGTEPNCRGVIYGTWQLSSKHARFGEVHQFLEAAFDGATFAGSINNVLIAAGFDPIPDVEMGAHLLNSRLPVAQAKQNFRFGVNPGDSGEDIIQRLLLLARGQWREYRVRYDWAAQRWRIEPKNRNTAASARWILTPFADERGVAVGGTPGTQVIHCGFPETPGQMKIFPPEANVVQAVGITEPGSSSKQVVGYPFKSIDSLSNPTSLSYLGRIVAARPLFDELRDSSEVDIMSRRLFDAVSTREEMQDIVITGMNLTRLNSFTPCGAGATNLGPPWVVIRGLDASGGRVDLLDGWLKRRHVAIEAGFCGSEKITLTLSTRWEAGILE